MFAVLHGLGYVQKWFQGLFEKEPVDDVQPTVLGRLPRSSEDEPSQDAVDAPVTNAACRRGGATPLNFGGKLLQKCFEAYCNRDEMNVEIENLKYETSVMRAWNTRAEYLHQLSSSPLDSKTYDSDGELFRLKRDYNKLEFELKRSTFELWLTKLNSIYRARGWTEIRKRETAPDEYRYDEQGDVGDDIEIKGINDIVAWDDTGMVESRFICKGSYGDFNTYRYLKTMKPIMVKDFTFTYDTTEFHRLYDSIQRERDVLGIVMGSEFFPKFLGLVRPCRSRLMIVMEFVGEEETGKTWTMSRALAYQCDIDVRMEAWFDVAVDVVSGMHFLHGERKLLNDLTPDNVLLYHCKRRRRWAAKIIDVGHVTTFDQGKVFQVDDEAKVLYRKGQNETHRFLAPEVVLGGVATSEKTDVYSIGMLLKEIVLRKGVMSFDFVTHPCLNAKARHRPTVQYVKTCLERIQRTGQV